MAKQGHRWRNADVDFAQEHEAGEEDDGPRIQMLRQDLVTREHRIEELGERGTRPAKMAWR